MNDISYTSGFFSKCAEMGLDGRTSVRLYKMAKDVPVTAGYSHPNYMKPFGAYGGLAGGLASLAGTALFGKRDEEGRKHWLRNLLIGAGAGGALGAGAGALANKLSDTDIVWSDDFRPPEFKNDTRSVADILSDNGAVRKETDRILGEVAKYNDPVNNPIDAMELPKVLDEAKANGVAPLPEILEARSKLYGGKDSRNTVFQANHPDIANDYSRRVFDNVTRGIAQNSMDEANDARRVADELAEAPGEEAVPQGAGQSSERPLRNLSTDAKVFYFTDASPSTVEQNLAGLGGDNAAITAYAYDLAHKARKLGVDLPLSTQRLLNSAIESTDPAKGPKAMAPAMGIRLPPRSGGAQAGQEYENRPLPAWAM